MFRAQMLSDDPALVELTERVLECVTELHWAENRRQLDERRTASRQGIRDFVATVTPHVR
ncbi:hypothetical protein AB0K09_10805 [Streptomyces sp. NPDC049577]|uniref:hypothetical protein n=1 Tax=Streptomyces sp. NPDC049577 TaxID=3155153 RepID=UPI0034257A38